MVQLLFWCILVNFVAFCCTLCATPWPLYDLLWLLSRFKRLFTPEMDHISHSGQIRNTLLCHVTVNILVHFVAFCCTLCATPWPLHNLFWLLSLFKCPSNPKIDHIGQLGQIWNTFARSWYFDLSDPFWCILVHFMGNLMTPLYWIYIKSLKIYVLCIKSFPTGPVPPS